MGGCMGQWVGSGQMTNLIKLELINIIWFCLKIYNLSRHPYLWVDGWVNGWAHVKPLKSNKSWPNRDNSIMDILDILLDILLKPPQPFIGLFFVSRIGYTLPMPPSRTQLPSQLTSHTPSPRNGISTRNSLISSLDLDSPQKFSLDWYLFLNGCLQITLIQIYFWYYKTI